MGFLAKKYAFSVMNIFDLLILCDSIDDMKHFCAGSMVLFGHGLSVELWIHLLFCVVVVRGVE
jgi:hypothetical protein